jgi:hypothetical protein
MSSSHFDPVIKWLTIFRPHLIMAIGKPDNFIWFSNGYHILVGCFVLFRIKMVGYQMPSTKAKLTI